MIRHQVRESCWGWLIWSQWGYSGLAYSTKISLNSVHCVSGKLFSTSGSDCVYPNSALLLIFSLVVVRSHTVPLRGKRFLPFRMHKIQARWQCCLREASRNVRMNVVGNKPWAKLWILRVGENVDATFFYPPHPPTLGPNIRDIYWWHAHWKARNWKLLGVRRVVAWKADISSACILSCRVSFQMDVLR